MATRPIFISTNNLENPFYQEDVNFTWVPGNTYNQKCKRRDSLKKEIEQLYDIKKWLEVSTKSDKEIGVKLSALNLKVTTTKRELSVEEIYQKSKVFENGKITGFRFGNTFFENTPYGMYYDYIYMLGLYQNKDYHKLIEDYNIFTDIEFNPNRSINTQARAISIFKTLYDNDYLDIIEERDRFKEYYKKYVKLKNINK